MVIVPFCVLFVCFPKSEVHEIISTVGRVLSLKVLSVDFYLAVSICCSFGIVIVISFMKGIRCFVGVCQKTCQKYHSTNGTE